MRVLVVPEVYRPDDLSSNGTVNDLIAWVDEWLSRDPTLHVYWLLPPRDRIGYEADTVGADRDRVTLIEADPPMAGTEFADRFTENGYSADQLAAIREHVFEPGGYLDVVVDQLRTGRFTLYKWLLIHVDQWAASVSPFDVVANVHDLQVPFKYRGCSYRNAYQMYQELSGVAFADGIWFTAGVDADEFRDRARRTFKPDIVEAAVDRSVVAGSPISFEHLDERYGEEPETLHLAGSLAEKKHADELVEIARILYDRLDIETVMTSMDPIPGAYCDPDWIDVYPDASREVYERMLARGDLAICASEYETMARTPFEQAASGQVLVLRDEPWIDDCVPDGYPFAGALEDLADLAVEAATSWDRAVEANKELVAQVKEVRHPARCGKRTYDDIRRRVREKQAQYISMEDSHGTKEKRTEVVSRALGSLDDTEGALDEISERTGQFTEDGRPLPEQPSCAPIDLVYTLRVLGYEDTGAPGMPVFRPQASGR